ncbi:TPA: hypothetical protein P8709_000998 [Acinetobacter baumannii]|nr:hypothetical protein [Acinetobacter baumannii]
MGQLQQQLQKILKTADFQHKSLDDLYDEHINLWQGLALSKTQVELWRKLVQQANNAELKDQICIEKHVLTLLQQAASERMLLTQILQRLPSNVRMTEQQLKKIIQLMAELEIKGPFVVLKG